MSETSKWLSEKEASEALNINKHTLDLLREFGYLKPGTHWRSSTDSGQLPWKPKVFYRTTECKAAIENWKGTDAGFDEMAA